MEKQERTFVIGICGELEDISGQLQEAHNLSSESFVQEILTEQIVAVEKMREMLLTG